ncbi:hypothetical protein Tco_0219352, partial [Tanacetum coccineum]
YSWNQINADTQDSYVAGSSGKDKGPTQEYILLPLQPHRIRILVEDVVHEKPSESSPKDNDVQDSEDAADKEEQHQMKESELTQSIANLGWFSVTLSSVAIFPASVYVTPPNWVAAEKGSGACYFSDQQHKIYIERPKSSFKTDTLDLTNVCYK